MMHFHRVAILVMAFLLSACHAGPDPIDVAADRDRWRAVRDCTADGAIDAQEAPALAMLLVAWDEKLTADELAAGAKQKPEAILADLLRVYGLAVVQLALVPEMKTHAPELFALLDKDTDGQLSADELRSIDPTSPVFAIVVASTVQRLIKEHRRGN